MANRDGKLILYVGVDENVRKLLVYIKRSIKDIRNAGFVIQIIKVNPKTLSAEDVKKFERRGITRFPSMIDPNGAVHVGVAKITSILEKNLTGGRIDDAASSHGDIIGSNSDLSDYYSRLLYEGKGSKRKPKKDDSDDEDRDRNDIDKRMQDYSRNVPKHRRGDESGGRRQKKKQPVSDDDSESSEEVPKTRRSRRRDDEQPTLRPGQRGSDRQLDDMMMAAFLNNQPSDA